MKTIRRTRFSFTVIAALVLIISFAMVNCGGGGGSDGGGAKPKWTGTKQLGVAGAYTEASGVAVDASGNVYVAGYTEGGLDGNTLMGGTDLFVTKYDSSGAKLYTRQTGTIGASTQAYGVAVDTSGSVYVAGYTNGGLDGNTLAGGFDYFLTKYNSAGTKLYTRQTGTAGAVTMAYGVAVDASGNVYVAGRTNGGLDGNSLMGGRDFFVTKYDSSGAKLYTRQTGTVGANTQAYAVAVDASGNVYVAGGTNGGLDGNTLAGGYDYSLTKYDSSGIKLFTRQTGTVGKYTQASGVAVDGSGNVYVAGFTNGGLDGKTLAGSWDYFLTKYDSSGTKLFTRQTGTVGKYTQASGVAVDGSDNVYVAGYTDGGLDGNILTGIRDFFVTKYDSSGNKVRTKQLGTVGASTEAYSVAVDAGGNVFVAGYTLGGLDGNTLTGTDDFFVTKYDPDGNKQ